MARQTGPILKPAKEKRLWTPSLGAYGGRRSRRKFFYEAFLPPTIADLELPLETDVASVVTEAEVAVRALNQASPRLGSLEVLARQLLRAEAVASSRIEGLEMSHRRLACAAAAPDQADATARGVLGNVRAMERAIELGTDARRIAVPHLLELHRELLQGTPEERRAGKIRDSQNWIGGRDDSPVDADFIPPPEGRVRTLLEDLCAFLSRDDIPAIAQAAVGHSQFETIHPFFDGNGRVGRCLIHVVLRRRGLAPSYVPPISLVLATNQGAYVAGLTAYRDYTVPRMNAWVGTFAQATRTSAERAREFAGRIEALQERWRERARVQRRGSAVDKVIARLPAEPVLDVRRANEIAGGVYEAARLAVEQLERAQVLYPVSTRRRDRLYEARDLFDLVDDLERKLATKTGARRPVRPAPHTRRPAGEATIRP